MQRSSFGKGWNLTRIWIFSKTKAYAKVFGGLASSPAKQNHHIIREASVKPNVLAMVEQVYSLEQRRKRNQGLWQNVTFPQTVDISSNFVKRILLKLAVLQDSPTTHCWCQSQVQGVTCASDRLYIGISHTPLFEFRELARAAHRTQENISLTICQFIIKI